MPKYEVTQYVKLTLLVDATSEEEAIEKALESAEDWDESGTDMEMEAYLASKE